MRPSEKSQRQHRNFPNRFRTKATPESAERCREKCATENPLKSRGPPFHEDESVPGFLLLGARSQSAGAAGRKNRAQSTLASAAGAQRPQSRARCPPPE